MDGLQWNTLLKWMILGFSHIFRNSHLSFNRKVVCVFSQFLPKSNLSISIMSLQRCELVKVGKL